IRSLVDFRGVAGGGLDVEGNAIKVLIVVVCGGKWGTMWVLQGFPAIA
ncbi:MAG: hypothetical protein RLZZ232_1360, partial [Planctomycetota bacterium]